MRGVWKKPSTSESMKLLRTCISVLFQIRNMKVKVEGPQNIGSSNLWPTIALRCISLVEVPRQSYKTSFILQESSGIRQTSTSSSQSTKKFTSSLLSRLPLFVHQTENMYFTKFFALTVFLAAGAFAAPNNPPPPPTKPAPPPQPTQTIVNQQNQCGNNVTPYCCISDNKGSYSSCSAMG